MSLWRQVNLLVAVMSDRFVVPLVDTYFAFMLVLLYSYLPTRYEEAKEKSVVSYFFNLFRLSRDYEVKVRTNPWTFVWYLLLWRISVAHKVKLTAGPAKEATTLHQKLFEFVEYVTNKKRPKVVRAHDSETALVERLSIIMKGPEADYNGSECLKLKQELRNAIHLKSQASWEEQRVQVYCCPY